MGLPIYTSFFVNIVDVIYRYQINYLTDLHYMIVLDTLNVMYSYFFPPTVPKYSPEPVNIFLQKMVNI